LQVANAGFIEFFLGMKTLDLESVEKEKMPPERFLKLSKEERANIKSVEIVPPALGSKGFGTLLVEKKVPTYKVKSQ
jgi:hypothetical protein